jgi:uncharacterized protein (DUF736 family)
LRIAEFVLEHVLNPQSEIANPKSQEWLIHPGSQQLGAKWVEVTKRGEKTSGDE